MVSMRNAACESRGRRHKEERGVQRTDVDTVVVPVAAGHVGVDICVDARHLGREGAGVAEMATRREGED